MRDRWRWLALLAAATVVVAGGATVAVHRWQAYRFRVAPTDTTPRPFDSTGWASGSATLRHAMAAHMATSGELVSLPRDELVGRLGPPTAERTPGVLQWDLGERQDPTGMMWNYDEYLRVALDERGVSLSVEVWDRD